MLIKPGNYVLDDMATAQCLSQTRGTEVRTEFVSNTPLKDLAPGHQITICRTGSFGDLLLLTPLIRQLAKQYPDNPVKVACHPRYAPILHGVVSTIDFPLTSERFREVERGILWMEGVLEDPNETGVRYTNRYARAAGIHRLDNERLDYVLTPEEEAWQIDTFPRKEGVNRIGIQVKASSLNRSYSQNLLSQVVLDVLKRPNTEVYLIGAPEEIKLPGQAIENLHNLCDHSLPVRMSIAVAKSCDVLLVPDSLFAHVASALEIPAVLLSGPFDPADTLGAAPTVETMRGTGACRNCRWLPMAGAQFPPAQLCSAENRCLVLDGISPTLIAEKLLRIVHDLKR